MHSPRHPIQSDTTPAASPWSGSASGAPHAPDAFYPIAGRFPAVCRALYRCGRPALARQPDSKSKPEPHRQCAGTTGAFRKSKVFIGIRGSACGYTSRRSLLHDGAVLFLRNEKYFPGRLMASPPDRSGQGRRLPQHARARIVCRDDESHRVPDRHADHHERGHLQKDHQRTPLIPVEAMRALLLRPSNPSMALPAAYAHFS